MLINLLYLPYYTFSRYAYPLMPLMMMFSGRFLYRFFHGTEKKLSST
ncbi:hypothetical protein [Clostridium polynesiense]|nr:hypothetical protein [Clostridium polynesiense]